jgi:ATP-dependent Clp protease ATP-binding subunit ClpB
MATDSSSKASANFLISASNYMKNYMKETGAGAQAVKDAAEAKANGRAAAPLPDFELIGRKKDMAEIGSVLLTKGKKNNLILTGQSGVGISSLIMGLQASKTDPSTPLDLVEKNIFYLDIDALFSSSEGKDINAGFQKAMDSLTMLTSQGKDVVLIVEDTKDFMNGVADNKATNIINKMMLAAKKNSHFQMIFAANDQDLPKLSGNHAGFRKYFTLKDVEEPPKDELRLIVEAAARDLGKKYDVEVSQKAIDSALELTDKFPLQNLPAQPTSSLIVLEGAITSHLLTAQTKPPGLDELQKTLDIVTIALATKKPAEGEYANRTPDELETIRLDRDTTIKRLMAEWDDKQKQIALLYTKVMRDINQIQVNNDQIASAKEAEKSRRAQKNDADEKFLAARQELEAAKARKADDGVILGLQRALNRIGQKYSMNTGDEWIEPKGGIQSSTAELNDDLSAWSSGDILKIEEERKKYEDDLIEKRAAYKALTANADGSPVEMTDDDVLAEFSRLSNVPMNKLQEDETEKLLGLAAEMKKYIFGQDGPIDALADAVITAKAGLKEPNQPIANFLFLGPSGTGKTETARVLARLLFGDESALEIFRMENYKDKTSINTLIGSPQGLVGYEEGGKLVNTARKKPYSVFLFDELEKAYPDIFDTFLAMCDDGVVEDTRGLKAYFGNIINIFTSNFGERYFMDPSKTPEQARDLAIEDLKNSGLFKPAFLNRLNIFCYNSLGQYEIVRIADKNLKELNEQAASKGVSVDMPKAEIEKMVAQQYDPYQGGRGIRSYIQQSIKPFVAKIMFKNKNAPGVVQISYTSGEIDDAAKDEIRAAVEAENDAQNNSVEGVKAQFDAVANGQPVPAPMDDKETKARIEDKIKAVEKEKAEISANFIPAPAEGAKPAASAAPVAANTNTPKPALAAVQ